MEIIQKELFAVVTCSPSTEKCVLQECDGCPDAAGITTEVLRVPEETTTKEVTFAYWCKADLEKRTTSFSTFLDEMINGTLKAIIYKFMKDIQRDEIKGVKEEANVSSKKIILHGDFAENWKIIRENEIQSAYWKSEQISIFTAVCYRGTETRNFAVVTDDIKHDSAHTLLAMSRILQIFEEIGDMEKITIISDGAPAHFKNLFQFHEFSQSPFNEHWVFSATGHGKGACDGIGEIVKYLATDHNLKNSDLDAIDSAETFVREVQKYTSVIKLILFSAEELEEFRKIKCREWKDVPTVTGIQKCHVLKVELNESGGKTS